MASVWRIWASFATQRSLKGRCACLLQQRHVQQHLGAVWCGWRAQAAFSWRAASLIAKRQAQRERQVCNARRSLPFARVLFDLVRNLVAICVQQGASRLYRMQLCVQAMRQVLLAWLKASDHEPDARLVALANHLARSKQLRCQQAMYRAWQQWAQQRAARQRCLHRHLHRCDLHTTRAVLQAWQCHAAAMCTARAAAVARATFAEAQVHAAQLAHMGQRGRKSAAVQPCAASRNSRHIKQARQAHLCALAAACSAHECCSTAC